MQKLKVDLIHLPSHGTGQTVYSENLAIELEKLVDLKVISPNKSFLFNFINSFNNSLAVKILPFLLTKKIRKNSLVHITNQQLFFLVPKINNLLILTLHDFSHFTFYKNWEKKDVMLLDKAQKIVCISDSAKKELTENFPGFEKKTCVVHLGVGNLIRSNKNIRKKFDIKENQKIILFAGSDDEKKNFFSLLKAFSELKEENLLLVKVGFQWTFSGKNKRKEFEEFIQKNSLQEKVLFFDFLSKQDLTDFYFASDVFVQPSLHEGFGLTLLEAMSCFCPVICSDIPPFHEVASDSALFFDPKNEKELKEKLELILSNQKLKKDLISKGLQNIKRFNWKKTAKETFEVYKEVLNETKT